VIILPPVECLVDTPNVSSGSPGIWDWCRVSGGGLNQPKRESSIGGSQRRMAPAQQTAPSLLFREGLAEAHGGHGRGRMGFCGQGN
jgi:hypothetical protein